MLTPTFFKLAGGFVLIILVALGTMVAFNLFNIQVQPESQIACPEEETEHC